MTRSTKPIQARTSQTLRTVYTRHVDSSTAIGTEIALDIVLRLLLFTRILIRPAERSVCCIAEVVGISCAIIVLCVALPNTELQAQDDPFGANWPQGEGRNLTGAWCGVCHSLNLVKHQGLTRDGWDDLLNWMSETQKIPPLHGEQRTTVLDYLAANFGVDSKGAVSSRKVRRGRPPLVKSGSGYRLSATAGNPTSWAIGRQFPEIKGAIHIVNASPARADVVFTIGASPV